MFQVWKQKGEEYRVTGGQGWMWISNTYTQSGVSQDTVGLRAVARKMWARRRKAAESVSKSIPPSPSTVSGGGSQDGEKAEKMDSESDNKTESAIKMEEIPKSENDNQEKDVKEEKCDTKEDVNSNIDEVKSSSNNSVAENKEIKMENSLKEKMDTTEIKQEKEEKMDLDVESVSPVKKTDNVSKTSIKEEPSGSKLLCENNKTSCDLFNSILPPKLENVELVDVSKSLMDRTHYPKITKPYAKLDLLLQKRLKQEEIENKQRQALQQQINWKLKVQNAVGKDESNSKMSDKCKSESDEKLNVDDDEPLLMNQDHDDECPFTCYSFSCRSKGKSVCYSALCKHSHMIDSGEIDADEDEDEEETNEKDDVNTGNRSMEDEEVDVENDKDSDQEDFKSGDLDVSKGSSDSGTSVVNSTSGKWTVLENEKENNEINKDNDESKKESGESNSASNELNKESDENIDNESQEQKGNDAQNSDTSGKNMETKTEADAQDSVQEKMETSESTEKGEVSSSGMVGIESAGDCAESDTKMDTESAENCVASSSKSEEKSDNVKTSESKVSIIADHAYLNRGTNVNSNSSDSGSKSVLSIVNSAANTSVNVTASSSVKSTVSSVNISSSASASTSVKTSTSSVTVNAAIKKPDGTKQAIKVTGPMSSSVSKLLSLKTGLEVSTIDKAQMVLRNAIEKMSIAELRAKMPPVRSTKDQIKLIKYAKFGQKSPAKKKASLPSCHKFLTPFGSRSLFVLDRSELKKLSRKGGRMETKGFNYNCKMNNVNWIYPCPRPLFRTTWRYRTQTVKSYGAAALQLRILWATLRWDDMSIKAPAGGTNTVSTETEITTTELLKRRDVGPDNLRSEFLVRKIVVPLGLPSQPKGRFTVIVLILVCMNVSINQKLCKISWIT